MKKSKRVVVGKYKNPEDVKAALQRLERDGYTRDDVSLYTNNSNIKKFEETNDIDMLADETKAVDETDKESFWDKIKHMVTYDHPEDSALDEQEEEMLEGYQEDLKDGYTVIAVRERAESAEEGTVREADGENTVLYETNLEMKNAEISDGRESTYQNGDFIDVYETDRSKKEETDTHFHDPKDFESDVTGTDYLDSTDNKEE